ncbi:asialoglycoprotein receptor 1-like [Ambystoma mexicanum]|uniref:asialoglycoprotein receptor 1-like n=1 Tax=Ambystoma mexicanum TaxID=8296 RepID=UPI0037E7CDD6
MEWRDRAEPRGGKLDTDITYAELNFLRASRLNVGSMTPDTPAVAAKPTLVCRTFTPSGFRTHLMRGLLLGSLLLVLLLLTASISLLCMYLHANARLAQEAEVLDVFRANSSRLEQELVIERLQREEAVRNRSSLEKECRVLQEQTVPNLIANHKQFLMEVEAEREQKQRVLEHYVEVQEKCNNMQQNSLFLSKNSFLYQNCNKTMDPRDPSGKCTFCPEGWLVFGSRCYFYSTTEQSWELSERSCRALDAHLAVIHSREEMRFVAEHINTTIWIGLSDRDIENDWRWVDGTPYAASPKFWPRNQPDNVGNEDCVTISQNMDWNDDKCWWLYTSMCQKAASVLHIQSGYISA